MNTLQVGPIIRYGWETFKKRPWFFIVALLVLTVLSNLSFEARDAGISDITPALGSSFALLSIVLFVVGTVAKMGANAFLLKAHASPETVKFADMWAPKPFWRFLGTMILKGIVVVGPMAGAFLLGATSFFIGGGVLFAAALIIGVGTVAWALFMGIRLAFSELVVMEKGLMPVDALKESYRMTENVFWQLVLLVLACAGVLVLGVLALVVGVLVAIPVVMLAYVHTYRMLATRMTS